MWTKILLLFFVFSFLFRSDLSFNQDLGRHIKLGEIIWRNKEVPKTNLFSYTNPESEFINTHWLFEVLVYGVDRTIGIQWMLALKLIIFLISIWLILKIIPKENYALLLPVAFIFLHVLRERLELRPEIFSFLFTALTLYILDRFCKTSSDPASPRLLGASRGTFNKVLILPVIQIIWINMHIYFFVGLILQAFFLIYMGYLKLRLHPWGANIKFLGIIFLLSFLVSFINPNGLNGLLYPFNVTKNYGYTIVENQTMFLLESISFQDPNFLFVKLTGALILASVLFALLSSRRTSGSNKLEAGRNGILKNLLLSLAGLILALMHVRSFPYLVFLSFPAVIQNFGPIKHNRITQIISVFFALLLILESYFYLSGDYYKYTDNAHETGLKMTQSVKGAMDFVLSNDLPRPVYNNFDIGSYILYRGFPKYKVFVDGRPEAYPSEFFLDIYIPTQADYAKFKELEAQLGFKTIIFSHTDQTPWGKNFLQNLSYDKDWNLIYIDDFTLVYTRPDVTNEKFLSEVELETLSPNSYQFTNHLSYLRLGYFLLSTGFQASGRKFIEKSYSVFPESPNTNAILGNTRKSKNYFFW